ncbi:MAG: O-antigen ligase family protein [Flavobacteriales bacterium]|nr:O-antigen ligase family protein [Flavobacteriales bacterium]
MEQAWIDRVGAARRVALLAVAVCLPLWPGGLPMLCGLLVVLMLPWGRGRWRLRPMQRNSLLPWFLGYYLVHVVGMAWSTNLKHGAFDLEVKLLAALLPLVVALDPLPWQVERGLVLRAFRWATALTFLVLLSRSSVIFIAELLLRAEGPVPNTLPWTNIFFSTYFSPWLHPSYLAHYGVFALASGALGPDLRSGPRWASVIDRGPVPLLLVLGVVLTASKAGWIGLALVAVYLLVIHWRERAVRRALLGASLGSALLLAGLVASFGTVRAKFTDTWHALVHTDPQGHDSSSARVLVWSAAMELVNASPWIGTGTGDVKDELIRVYGERGYAYPLEHRLNAHSQLVQSAVALGVPFALYLLLALLVPLVSAVRARDHLLVSFIVLALVNWSFESMLEVQAGVVFFLFFAAVLDPSAKPERHP